MGGTQKPEATAGRCGWAAAEPERSYHDAEWGVPVHDDRLLFEMLILEGAQAGLSWRTILNKHDAYRKAYAGFAPAKVARFDARKKAALLANPGIVRNRLKVEGSVLSARAFLAVQEEFGSFDAFLWRYVDGRPLQPRLRAMTDVLPRTPLSDTISKDLARRGFKFVGSTIVYAFMQAVGLTNDHVVTCPRHEAVRAAAAADRGRR